MIKEVSDFDKHTILMFFQKSEPAQDAVNKNRIQGLYNLAILKGFDADLISSLTAILEEAGINILENTKVIFPNMYFNCNIRSVVIPNNVKILQPSCFRDCRELNSVTIPTSVTAFDNSCFKGTAVKEINYLGTREQMRKVFLRTWDYNKIKIYCTDGEYKGSFVL